MSVSGRAGLFTMDDGRFFGDLRGTPYTASKRQKSGALRLEFGKFSLTAGSQTSATVATTVNTGITTIVSPSRVPVAIGTSGGSWIVTSPGNFLSGIVDIQILANGQFSGQTSGIDINYMVIGY
jgi:hypothetical protein